MADDKRISELAELATAPAVDDSICIVDTSDTSMAATGTDKRITLPNLISGYVDQAVKTTSTPSFAGAALTGNLDMSANDIISTGSIGRDVDNEINWGTDNSLAIVINGVTNNIVGIDTGAGDNDTLVTQGYVDDSIPTLPVKATGAEIDTGTDDAKFATPKALAESHLFEPFPIGAVFISVVSTSPATLLGYGTWSAFAQGRMLVGLNSSDADFDTAEETSGAKTHTISEAEMPAHNHTGPSHYHTVNPPATNTDDDSHAHSLTVYKHAATSGTRAEGTANASVQGTVSTAGDTHSHTVDIAQFNSGSAGTGATGSTGSGDAYSIMSPYIVTYMWKRTS